MLKNYSLNLLTYLEISIQKKKIVTSKEIAETQLLINKPNLKTKKGNGNQNEKVSRNTLKPMTQKTKRSYLKKRKDIFHPHFYYLKIFFFYLYMLKYIKQKSI